MIVEIDREYNNNEIYTCGLLIHPKHWKAAIRLKMSVTSCAFQMNFLHYT